VANRTRAQTAHSAYGNHQTPINIIDTAVTYDPAAPTFGNTSSLMSELDFLAQKHYGKSFLPH
jgi:hypothetical protein